MRLDDHFHTTGATLFRWRSYLLLAFLPIILWVATGGERIETAFGDLIGDSVEVLALLLVLAGCLGRILTVGFVPRGTSGRNTGEGQVAEVLNTSGAYSLVRNPLYLANCLIYLGIALFTQSLVLVLVFALVLVPYYERIIAAEERFLAAKFGAAYEDWAARTPAFWPKTSGFVRPSLPFSARWALRREHATVAGALVALCLVEFALNLVDTPIEPMDVEWVVLFVAVLVAEAVAHVVKRRTRLWAVDR